MEREILTHRVRRMEEELGRSVPLTAADNSAAQLAIVTTKYRALLHHHTLQMKERQVELEGEVERRQLLEEREELRQMLESAREKVHSLQASLNLVKANKTNIQVNLFMNQSLMCLSLHCVSIKSLLHSLYTLIPFLYICDPFL